MFGHRKGISRGGCQRGLLATVHFFTPMCSTIEFVHLPLCQGALVSLFPSTFPWGFRLLTVLCHRLWSPAPVSGLCILPDPELGLPSVPLSPFLPLLPSHFLSVEPGSLSMPFPFLFNLHQPSSHSVLPFEALVSWSSVAALSAMGCGTPEGAQCYGSTSHPSKFLPFSDP